MIDITEQSLESRIFYFHEFIYFTETLSFEHDGVDNLVGYFLDLLILFDEILIPAEHLNISSNDKEDFFKQKFISNKIIQELIYRGKIVTTIWSQCSTPKEQYEATERYLSVIGVKERPYLKEIQKNLSGIQVYKRNPTHQSNKAKGYAKVINDDINPTAISNKVSDLLRYEDGNILISFSHEKLILGYAAHLATDEIFMKSSKKSYIQAMPDGNGRVYRSLITGIESTPYGDSTVFHPVNPLPGDVNPLLFTQEVLPKLLAKFSFLRPSNRVYSEKKWLNWFLSFNSSVAIKEFRNKAFQALKYLSLFRLDTMTALDESLKYIHVVRYWNVGQLMWSIIDWTSMLVATSTQAHEFVLNKMQDRLFYFPSRIVEEYNSCSIKYSPQRT